MKSKTIYIALFCFVILYTSCSKITENIQEDIFVSDTVAFNIPILADITSTPIISGIVSTLNLEEQLKKSANSYGIENIKATKITSLNLKLDTLPKLDVNNNFGNLETVNFGIPASGKVANIAVTTIPSTSTIIGLALTPTILPGDFNSFLINPSRTYSMAVKAKKVTTTPLKVKGTLTYTITLSK
ncbi:hypothetical protein FBD94_17055 [Pedobacter hiemivivus]|uniref:Uncharacterized protein n=1 Tax=Pedobacter hiemivivus TaxID=2530454 RepID=A0A4U1G8Q6_9SPHI|nr:hypothetical protein [Pedobacter hiemivivus]TKC59239.1 hypothetical protein FBD94_17055 [Pedobacter hiemivivus]